MIIYTATISGYIAESEGVLLCPKPLIILFKFVLLVYAVRNASFHHLHSNGLFWEHLQSRMEIGLSEAGSNV